MYSYGTPHMAEQKQDDQLEHTRSSYVRIQDVALKTCQRRGTIGRSGERGSGVSMLVVQHDDDKPEYLILYGLKTENCKEKKFLNNMKDCCENFTKYLISR